MPASINSPHPESLMDSRVIADLRMEVAGSPEKMAAIYMAPRVAVQVVTM
jgi:hypothetical protein